MDVNTYYLQLITEYFLAVEIDEQSHEGRTLIFEKWHYKKKTGIRKKQMMQEEAMMQTMKLVKYKYLSVNIKTKK